MVICDLNVMRPVRFPDEADAILIVDTDAVLSAAIAAEPLQPVSRRDPEVGQCPRRVQHEELSQCNAPQIRREPPILTSLP
jgi:hypothetical protein